MKFRKKPIVIEAHQWFKNSDHPKDNCRMIVPVPGDGEPFLSEGKIVRYYRHPNVSGEIVCSECSHTMHEHGWIDTREGGHVVCIGDWIITGIKGENYPCKPDIFKDSYEPANQPSLLEEIARLREQIAEVQSERAKYLVERNQAKEAVRLMGEALNVYASHGDEDCKFHSCCNDTAEETLSNPLVAKFLEEGK